MTREERGQALVLTVAMLAVAAVALVGLRAASDRVLDAVRDDRAGEAAVAAAGAAVADLELDRAKRIGHELDKAETAALAAEPAVADAARSAAISMARIHGRAEPSAVSVIAYGYEIEVHLTLAGRAHIALLEAQP